MSRIGPLWIHFVHSEILQSRIELNAGAPRIVSLIRTLSRFTETDRGTVSLSLNFLYSVMDGRLSSVFGRRNVYI